MDLNKIIFMGSPDFALPTLQAIHQQFQVNAVFTRADAPKGRNQTLTPTPIKTWAQNQQIPVYCPLTKLELASLIKQIQPSLIIIIAYGMILPKEITDNFLCLNLHGSLLPKYRGPSPIQACLLNNDPETGITLMKINETMDTGDILTQKKLKLEPTDNFGQLHDKLTELSANLILEFLINNQSNSNLIFTPQNHNLATYCPKIKKEDLQLSLNINPHDFVAKVKAFSPFPGAFILADNGKRYKILDAAVKDNQIQIITIQPEGKKPMNYHDFILGYGKVFCLLVGW
jgi:methionyl-tRNA formyltransferase